LYEKLVFSQYLTYRCSQIIALHFALSTPKGFELFPIGPQFYMTCFNFKVTGDGNATPKGTKFPGAYHLDEPGFHYDVANSHEAYPTVGPTLYKSQFNANLEPKEHVVISPTGQGKEADDAYYNAQYKVLAQQGAVVAYFDSIGG
jgi:hypothetical protein